LTTVIVREILPYLVLRLYEVAESIVRLRGDVVEADDSSCEAERNCRPELREGSGVNLYWTEIKANERMNCHNVLLIHT